jgi:glutathione S-transferase
MKITLFGGKNYDRSGKIRWLLEEMGVPHNNHWLNTEENEHEKPAYLKVNPLGRVPAITVDAVPMIESGAIVTYLADQFPKSGLAPSLDSKRRMDFMQWMFFAVSIDSFAARISIIEDIPAGEVLEKKMEALITEFKDHVGFIGESLDGKDYLLGSFSAADVSLGYHLYFAALWPELSDVINNDKNVQSYLARLKKRSHLKLKK